jgi:subtilisin family serine protease
MTAATQVVRRFEVHALSGRPIRDVARIIDGIVKAPSAHVAHATSTIERPPLVEIRLEGVARAVADVTGRLAKIPGTRIRNDSLTVVRDRRNGPVYPDPDASVRIGADSVPAGNGVPVTVAIVDSGLMVDHPAFNDHLWTGSGKIHGKQFIEGKGEQDISDSDGHGTLLAGTILAAAVDAPVKLMVAKFFDAAHPARPGNAAPALEFAVREKAKIIVLAWDVGIGSVELERAFRDACQHALVVIAAGNYGSDNDWRDGRSWARVPVRYAKEYRASTIVVMATDEIDEKAWFSNYGRESVDLAAPGFNTVSTRRAVSRGPRDTPPKYRTHSGTSGAAAYVAGAAALLMSRYPRLSVEQIKRCLVTSVDELPALKCAARGRLNIAAALRGAARGGVTS